jgi:hypothetical protein
VRNTFITLILLLALGAPGLAQQGPALRVKSYLEMLPKARTLAEVRPFFSREFWDYTYAPLLDAPAQEQAELLADTAKELQGFSVKGESIDGQRATVDIADAKGQVTPLVLIKENGVWVIHMEYDESGEQDE